MFLITTLYVVCFLTSVAVLAVPAQPVFDTTDLSITAPPGSTVKLLCSIRNLGPYKVMWNDKFLRLITYQEVIVYDDLRYSMERLSVNDWNLVINDVRPSDEGDYTCKISTYPVQSKRVHLIVDVPVNQRSENAVKVLRHSR